jgi:hypothetical protein
MIDPVVIAAVALGGYRLVTSAERGAPRGAAHDDYRLVKCAKSLPAGTEVGEVRPDGSSWWIRIPAPASS